MNTKTNQTFLMSQSDVNATAVNTAIALLKGINVDGETMEYVLEQIGMTDQMLRQLIMSNPESDTKDILNEKISLTNEQLASHSVAITDSEQALLDELNNFIEYAYSDDDDRERMRRCAYDFVTEVVREQIDQSEPKRISLDITQMHSNLYFDILNEFKEQHNLTDIDAVIDWNIEATIERD